MCGAFVLYSFLRAGLVSGEIFPDFDKLGLEFSDFSGGDTPPKIAALISRSVGPSRALNLLTMWSFVAGFSERLVPTILSNTEASFANAASGAGGNTSK